jgi:hypothetical protein
MLTELVLMELDPEFASGDEIDPNVDLVVKKTAKVLAAFAWQLDCLSDRIKDYPFPEEVKELQGPPAQPTWLDVCKWLARAAGTGPKPDVEVIATEDQPSTEGQ